MNSIPQTIFLLCFTVPSSDRTVKVTTRKELLLLETPITEFHEKLYIPAIQKLAFRLTHVRILGTHHCGKELCEAFKRRGNLHDVLCRSDYKDWLVSSVDHQIQS